jgi:type III secretion protein R
MPGGETNLIGLLAVVLAIGLVPFLAVTTTAFLKISIVLFLIRNAMGTQTVPPNLVLYAVALVLALYVSAPMLGEVLTRLTDPTMDLTTIPGITRAAEGAAAPVRAFLVRFTSEAERQSLLATAARIWPPEAHARATSEDLLVLMPSFVLAELRRAFEIGFLIYLPFIAVDLIVSNVLMAMGMMMVSPLVISVPFKLFVFVLVDGWSRLVNGLLLSYATG